MSPRRVEATDYYQGGTVQRSTLDDLETALAAGTPGPWGWMADHPLHRGPYVGAPGLSRREHRNTPLGIYVATTASDANKVGDADAALIVAAVNALPKLIAVARAAEAVADRLDNAQIAWGDYPELDHEHEDLRAALAALEADDEPTK